MLQQTLPGGFVFPFTEADRLSMHVDGYATF